MALKLLGAPSGCDCAVECAFRSKYELIPRESLGSGSFGIVFAGKDKRTLSEFTDIALKMFTFEQPKDMWRRDAAFQEVAAHTALPPHSSIVPLLDVCGLVGKIYLVFPRFSSTLRVLVESRKLEVEEVQHAMHSLFRGAEHMHVHGLLHGDLKPDNILVQGVGLGSSAASMEPRRLARQLLHLHEEFRVCICDLGAAVPGNPAHRYVQAQRNVEEVGLQEGTLWYRAPELIYGDRHFSYPVDCWALACVAGELTSGRPIFAAQAEILIGMKIFRLLGTPQDDSLLQWWPLLKDTHPKFAPAVWPPEWLEGQSPELIDFMAKLWVLAPVHRLDSQEACCHAYFQRSQLPILHATVPAGRGPFSVAAGLLEPRLLKWLQGDPYWAEVVLLAEQHGFKQCLKEGEAALGLKYEEGGYVSDEQPDCCVWATLDMHYPIGAWRVACFAKALHNVNNAWFTRLTEKVRAVLCRMPSDLLTKNGKDFFHTCFTKTAFCYAVIQVMRVGERKDPKHFDGAASLPHMGLTIFGSRDVEFWFGDGRSQILAQRPGALYIGNPGLVYANQQSWRRLCMVRLRIIANTCTHFTRHMFHNGPATQGIHLLYNIVTVYTPATVLSLTSIRPASVSLLLIHICI